MTHNQEKELHDNTVMLAEMHAILVKNGLVQAVKDIRDNMVTKEDCDSERENCMALRTQAAEAKKSIWKTLDRIIVISLTVVTIGFGSGIFLKTCSSERQSKEAATQSEKALNLLEDRGSIR